MKNDWKIKKLGGICDILDNQRKPVTQRDRIIGKYPYYGATGIQDYVNDYIFDEKLILIGEDGAKWGAGENTAFTAEGKYWVNNHAHVIRPHRDTVLDNWIIYFLNVNDLSRYITGLTVQKLNLGKLRKIEIPLPPLFEQKRIVKILDEFFKNIEKAKENAEKNLQNSRELFESYLQNIFANPNSSWSKKQLRSIAKITMGQSPKGSTYNTRGDGIPLINGPVEFSPDQLSKTFITKYTSKPTKLCKKGDLILCVRGSTTGRTNIAGYDSCLGRGVASICANEKLINQNLLNIYIAHMRKSIFNLGTGATFPNVSSDLLSSIEIAFPPIAKQKAIVKKLNQLSEQTKKLKEIYGQKLADLEELKKSVIQKAFAGEL